MCRGLSAAGKSAMQEVLARNAAIDDLAVKESPRPVVRQWPGSQSDNENKEAIAYYRLCVSKGHEWDAARRRIKEESHAEAEKGRHEAAVRRLNEMFRNGEAWAWVVKEINEASIEFESNGWDIVIREPGWFLPTLAIELKPQVGDDYPAVLRAIKNEGRPVLIVDRFEAEGVTLDDVKWIFQQSRIAVRTLAEIRALMLAKAP